MTNQTTNEASLISSSHSYWNFCLKMVNCAFNQAEGLITITLCLLLQHFQGFDGDQHSFYEYRTEHVSLFLLCLVLLIRKNSWLLPLFKYQDMMLVPCVEMRRGDREHRYNRTDLFLTFQRGCKVSSFSLLQTKLLWNNWTAPEHLRLTFVTWYGGSLHMRSHQEQSGITHNGYWINVQDVLVMY